jgi:hypothetical protein
MTVSMSRAKKWPLESVTVNLRHSKIHAADGQDYDAAWVIRVVCGA